MYVVDIPRLIVNHKSNIESSMGEERTTKFQVMAGIMMIDNMGGQFFQDDQQPKLFDNSC